MVEDMNTTAALEPDKEAAVEARFLAAKEIADKHGYYYSVLSDEEKVEYRLALSREGFDQEIALLQTKMKSMQLLFPFNLAMIARFLNLLERLDKAQRAHSKHDEGSKPESAIDKMFSKFGFPPGPTGQRLRENHGMA